MRIDCPACAAAYEVPDALLAGQRQARCARCGHQWRPEAPPPPISLRPSEDPPPLAAPDPPTSRAAFPAPEAAPLVPRAASTARSPALGLAWAASLLLLVAAGIAAVAFRAPIGRAWPPSLRLYAALGLDGTAR